MADWSFVKISVWLCHSHIDRDGDLSHKVDLLTYLHIFVNSKFWRAFKLNDRFKSYGIFAWICRAESNDYSAHWQCRNCKHTLETPKISTRRPQNPIEAIGPPCHRQEVQKKLLQITNIGRKWHIDILTCLYQYVNYRGGKCGEFGGSRSTKVFLNTNLSLLEVTLVVRRNTHFKDGEVYRRSLSSLLSIKIEGS